MSKCQQPWDSELVVPLWSVFPFPNVPDQSFSVVILSLTIIHGLGSESVYTSGGCIMEYTHILKRVFNQISENLHRVTLPDTVNSVECLFLYHGVPVRLQEMHLWSHGKIEPEPPFIRVWLLTYIVCVFIGFGLHTQCHRPWGIPVSRLFQGHF